ncbi:MAG: class I SAM-dependent methyltransferase, partial [Planctomycetota bacterium JB042]
LAWTFPPAPGTTSFRTVYAYLMKEGDGPVRCERDEHELGLFPRAEWLERLGAAGFDARAVPFEHSTFEEGTAREMFVGVRG